MNVVTKIKGEMKGEGEHDFSMTVCNMPRKSKGKHINGQSRPGHGAYSVLLI